MGYQPGMLEKMQTYFKARMEELKGSGRTRDLVLGSPPGLALELEISVSKLKSFEGAEDDAAEFYQEFLTRYEILCDQYVAAGYMTAPYRASLAESLFSSQAGDDKTGIHLAFMVYNAPDDYEHYLKIAKKCKDGGISLNKALTIISGWIEEQA